MFSASDAEVRMGLEEDLKARTLALISQQMANWVVEIQRAIQGHQASLLRELDELGETVARYDEKVDEQSIGAAMAAAERSESRGAGREGEERQAEGAGHRARGGAEALRRCGDARGGGTGGARGDSSDL
mgnify:CR=1 FL=1